MDRIDFDEEQMELVQKPLENEIVTAMTKELILQLKQFKNIEGMRRSSV